MRVVETTLGTEWKHEPSSRLFRIVERVLSKIIPAANPDFEGHFHRVRKWWIEIDEHGIPQREVGFDAHGQVIVATPLGNNFGFWTDSTMTFDIFAHYAITMEAFEKAWSEFEIEWKAAGMQL